MIRLIIVGIFLVVAIPFALFAQPSTPSGSPSDSQVERDEETHTVSRVYETVDGNPSVVWTHPPTFSGGRLSLSGVLDPVVPTNQLAVILFHQEPDSGEVWCNVAGKPWLKIVGPPPPGAYYSRSSASMYCTVVYSTPDNRVSGKETFSDMPKPSTVETVSFSFRPTHDWNVDGRTFNIRATLPPQSDLLGVHTVTLWAGPEQLAVYVIGQDAP